MQIYNLVNASNMQHQEYTEYIMQVLLLVFICNFMYYEMGETISVLMIYTSTHKMNLHFLYILSTLWYYSLLYIYVMLCTSQFIDTQITLHVYGDIKLVLLSLQYGFIIKINNLLSSLYSVAAWIPVSYQICRQTVRQFAHSCD